MIVLLAQNNSSSLENWLTTSIGSTILTNSICKRARRQNHCRFPEPALKPSVGYFTFSDESVRSTYTNFRRRRSSSSKYCGMTLDRNTIDDCISHHLIRQVRYLSQRFYCLVEDRRHQITNVIIAWRDNIHIIWRQEYNRSTVPHQRQAGNTE